MNDLGEVNYILGIQIIHDRKNRSIALSQALYVDNVLSKFNMQDSKKGFLLFLLGVKILKEQSPKNAQEEEDMNKILYSSALGSLMYVMLCIDVTYVL